MSPDPLSPPLPVLHVLGQFDQAHAGAGLGRLALAESLRAYRPVQAWSTVAPHPSFVQRGVRRIRAFAGEFPRGGLLLITGIHVDLGPWLAHAGLQSVELHYNLPDHGRLFARVAQIRQATGADPQLVFVSQAMQAAVGLPGRVQPSLIDMAPYRVIARQAGHRPRVLGRHSRDVAEKHHPDDVGLYRLLASRGWTVRLMGATVLAPALGSVPGIELWPEGAQPVPEFLAGLDVFVYRTTMAEAYGRVIYEAMASALPVVALAQGGYVSDLADGRAGCLFRNNEEATLLLGRMAAEPEWAWQIGQAARARCETLHGPSAWARVQDHYR